MKELPHKLYKILDTHTDKHWVTHNGKAVWMKAGHAKSAWSNSMWRKKIKFNDQIRYKILEYSVDVWNMKIID